MPALVPDKPLARVVRIVRIDPIPKADSLELATVLGYEYCIAKKDNLRVGDLVLYFGLDAVLEHNEDTAFLDRQRIKIRKMCGQVSEGLIAPLAWAVRFGLSLDTLTEGRDVTSEMRVMQWIPEEELASSHQRATGNGNEQQGSLQSGVLGTLIPKTQQTRLQDNPNALRTLQSRHVLVTLKMDGCSATYAWHDGGFRVYSRNVDVTELVSSRTIEHYHRWARLHNLAARMRALGRHLAVQGELCDRSINGGRTGVTSLQFYVFHVWDVGHQRYLSWNDMSEVVRTLELETVPVLYNDYGLPPVLGDTVNSVLLWVNQQRYASGLPAEGVVISSDECDNGRRVSYKAVSPEYMLATSGKSRVRR